MIMSNLRSNYLFAILAGLILSIASLHAGASESGVPSFIKVGKTYSFHMKGDTIDVPMTVVSIPGDGWIEVRFQNKDQKEANKSFFINLVGISTIIPEE